MIRRLLIALVVLLLVVAALVLALARGWLGQHQGPGAVVRAPRPADVVADRVRQQRRGALRQGVAAPKQILFGDFHVHTTFSFDAFLQSLPAFGGEGARPPADACDFARFCSALDFWSINDHAEGLTPRQWRETVESIRQCNDVAGDGEDPDSVAFLGWEWSQIDFLPDTHYGHKNVVLRHTDDERIPLRPIGSISSFTSGAAGPPPVAARVFFGTRGGQRGRDFVRLMLDASAVPACPDGVPVRDLPADCRERVATPDELFAKLDDWGHDSIVIPHGNAWGLYTPATSSWDKQLEGHDPDRQTLMEVYSGHGNSEEYRDFRAHARTPDGRSHCPEPTTDYLPACWRAGEIIEQRCLQEGTGAEECASRATVARQRHVDALLAGHKTVPGATPYDWLDAGQCRDCFQPAFNYRPAGSAQYMLAVRRFDSTGAPLRFRMGFIGSSDNHTARGGNGYKELGRGRMTDGRGYRAGTSVSGLAPSDAREPAPESVAFDPLTSQVRGLALFNFERVGSFMVTGGLVAVHAEGRGRDAIWEALERREVYATSGPRILLWFDLLNRDLPMGSSTALAEVPRFRVRAAGSLEQKPGCPAHVSELLGEERLQQLCLGECYHPSETRRPITRIEIVRVRPQNRPDEPIAELVEDPWRVFECPADPAGCTATFGDPEFTTLGRDTVYYARAIEVPTLAINGGGLRCQYDAEGRCLEVDPCGGLKPFEDDCLAESEQRAWSSPIFVDWAGGKPAE